MKKQLLFLLITVLSFNCYSQISFEKGYYIDNTNQKTDCLIKNIDWGNNPAEFTCKLSENSESQKLTIESVKEFGIYNISKYVRNNINIDRSSENVSDLSTNKEPVFNEEQLFLKVLVEGKASLYLYEDGNLRRYFYNKDNSNIEQLIFKSYKTIDNEIAKNNSFRQQLWIDLKCADLTVSKFENIGYNKNELVRLFVDYNECASQKFVNFEEKQKKDLFNLSLRPGLNYSSLSMQHSTTHYKTIDFDSEFGFRLGIEAELILPFNKNKWAVLIEPTYQYYKSEKELKIQDVKINYKSVELPVGIRHYFFLNENSKVFVNGSFVVDLSDKSVIDFSSSKDLEIRTRTNIAFGLGYKHKDKYSLELRYQTGREILSSYLFWNSDYNTLSVIVGYSLF
uniref:hypothetical protein n=1 Tax=uncultured Draconibacterium sp. TaxID=1573823 RepID=UPI003217F8DE